MTDQLKIPQRELQFSGVDWRYSSIITISMPKIPGFTGVNNVSMEKKVSNRIGLRYGLRNFIFNFSAFTCNKYGNNSLFVK